MWKRRQVQSRVLQRYTQLRPSSSSQNLTDQIAGLLPQNDDESRFNFLDRSADPISRELSPERESIMAIQVTLNDESLQRNAALHQENKELSEKSR